MKALATLILISLWQVCAVSPLRNIIQNISFLPFKRIYFLCSSHIFCFSHYPTKCTSKPLCDCVVCVCVERESNVIVVSLTRGMQSRTRAKHCIWQLSYFKCSKTVCACVWPCVCVCTRCWRRHIFLSPHCLHLQTCHAKVKVHHALEIICFPFIFLVTF